VKVHDLHGARLDLWAAKAAGVTEARIVDGVCRIPASQEVQRPLHAAAVNYRPSSDWADGGPIIESERISVWRYADLDSWHAGTQFSCERDEGLQTLHYYQGSTPLIAAMRCFIASKFGDEVEQGLDR
jgi:hypothetical protein